MPPHPVSEIALKLGNTMANSKLTAIPSDVMAKLIRNAHEKVLVLAQISAGMPVSMKSPFAPGGRVVYTPNEYQKKQAADELARLSQMVPKEKLKASKDDYLRNRKTVPLRHRR